MPCHPPGHLPNPGIEPTSLMSPALADQLFTTSATWEALETTGQTPKTQQTRRHSQRQGRTALPSQEAQGSETVVQVGPVPYPSCPQILTSSLLPAPAGNCLLIQLIPSAEVGAEAWALRSGVSEFQFGLCYFWLCDPGLHLPKPQSPYLQSKNHNACCRLL